MGAVVIAVGVDPSGYDALGVLSYAASEGAACVAFKTGQPLPQRLLDAAVQCNLAILLVGPDVSWSHFHSLLVGALASSGEPESMSDMASVPMGDLFGLATAVAALLGGAVIEDPHRRVLAYSNLPDQPIDELRRRSILRLRVQPNRTPVPTPMTRIASCGDPMSHAVSTIRVCSCPVSGSRCSSRAGPRSIGGLRSRSLRSGRRHAGGGDPAPRTGTSLRRPAARVGGLGGDDDPRPSGRDPRGGARPGPGPGRPGNRGAPTHHRAGAAPDALPEGDRYLGFLFARADGREGVEHALRTAHGHLEIVIGAQE